MSKVLALLAAAPLAACTTEQPATALAQFKGAQLELTTANDAKLIEPQFPAVTRLTLAAPDGDCVRLGDDVTADLDGIRMQVIALGGAWDSFGESGCDLASFELAQAPATRGTSTLLVRDSATTWTITGVDLFANDFVLVGDAVAGHNAEVVWQSADSPTSGAYVQFEQDGTVMFDNALDANQVAARGNMFDIALPATVTGAGTLSLNSSRPATATRCDGPASCKLAIGAGADLATTITAAPRNPQQAGQADTSLVE